VEGNLGEDIYIFTSQLLKKMKARAKKKRIERADEKEKKKYFGTGGEKIFLR
jgi:transposase